jgi:hypothetical protein
MSTAKCKANPIPKKGDGFFTVTETKLISKQQKSRLIGGYFFANNIWRLSLQLFWLMRLKPIGQGGVHPCLPARP